jgi:23S rRNA (uridine2552-2'-O)-methyltransferase
MRVLDLGAAPGSWAMYAARKIGDKGQLLATDLEPLALPLPSNASFMQGDALSLSNDALSRFAPYDVVLSDMAPRTTGSRVTDQARSFELFMRALGVAAALGAPGGAFVGKIFMSDDLPSARAQLRKIYASERLIRPESTRSISMEIFAVGSGKRS